MESAPAPTLCANCGKGEEESNKLKKCGACLLVKYCSAACQKAHRPQHKKACKKRAAELYDEKLFKEVEREDCPICLLPRSGETGTELLQACCGKVICGGCIYAMKMNSGVKDLCPFCRTKGLTSKERIERLKKHADSGNADACYLFGCYYLGGEEGMPQDFQKANELLLKAGELGCATAYYNLGLSHDLGNGVERNEKKAKQYWELAAMMGHTKARHNLACLEGAAGNVHRAMKHFMIAARAGETVSLDMVKEGFMEGDVTKDEYANTLRTYQKIRGEMKSDDEREKAAVLGTDRILHRY